MVLYVGYFVFMFLFLTGAFDSDYTVTELKESFNEKKSEIYELKRYFRGIVPKDKLVYIEFDDDNTLSRFGIATAGDNGYENNVMEWNIETDTEHMESIIRPLGWTRETLSVLKQKLDAADCIGITSGEPAQIAFKRSGMGMYSFNVFDKPIPDSLKTKYNDSCTYIYANNRLVLEYGGGAIGAQCFYKLE